MCIQLVNAAIFHTGMNVGRTEIGEMTERMTEEALKLKTSLPGIKIMIEILDMAGLEMKATASVLEHLLLVYSFPFENAANHMFIGLF